MNAPFSMRGRASPFFERIGELIRAQQSLAAAETKAKRAILGAYRAGKLSQETATQLIREYRLGAA